MCPPSRDKSDSSPIMSDPDPDHPSLVLPMKAFGKGDENPVPNPALSNIESIVSNQVSSADGRRGHSGEYGNKRHLGT